ncbi:MAG: phosphotransferase family protein [Acidimicrobiales bacterium]|nr:phosphotransferase family protein [Acidimicrobiales bacterium]
MDKPDGNGMSSDTVLFTLRWGGSDRPMVARIEPRLDDVPVFPSYDLDLQRRAMTLVDETTTAPVPKPVFWSDDPAIVGAPFFLMDRIDGRVPPDVLPYTFPGDGWLLNASTDEHRRLERSAVTALAAIHEVTPETHDLTFVRSPVTGRSVLEDHLDRWTEYSRWVTAESPSPLLEEAFAWLRDNLPTGLGPERLAWGDARIGNMIFQGFDVAAVLDWEMVDVAPPEIDLGWMAYLHRFFQDLTTDLGEAGLPDLLRPTTLRGLYEDATDRKVGDLRWPMAYAAIRHGAIMRRVGERLVQFGQQERPDDPDDLIMHGRQIRAMLDGSYWDTVDL